MHVLIITSEELNEKNTHSSCFELAQARALMKKGVKAAILSMGAITTKSVIKAFFLRFANKRSHELRLKDLGAARLLWLSIATFIKSISRWKTTRRLNIEGVIVYEALISKNKDFFISHLTHETCIEYGLKTAGAYIKDHGNPNLVHAHSRFLLASLLAFELKKKYGIRYLITEHSSYYVRELINSDFKDMAVQTIEKAELFSTVSSKLAEWVNSGLEKNYPECRLPNIIDPHFEEPIPDVNTGNEFFTFLNVAALRKNKGQSTLLKAFSILQDKHPAIKLRIVGAGEEMDKLKKSANDLGLQSKVSFLGHLPVSAVREEMLASDCFVLASEFETFGVVVIEAHACGKPVISTRCGGPEELINETNGLLVDPNDAGALSEAMEKIYLKKGTYNAKQIRDFCIQHYGQQAIAEKLIEVYNSILSK